MIKLKCPDTGDVKSFQPVDAREHEKNGWTRVSGSPAGKNVEVKEPEPDPTAEEAGEGGSENAGTGENGPSISGVGDVDPVDDSEIDLPEDDEDDEEDTE